MGQWLALLAAAVAVGVVVTCVIWRLRKQRRTRLRLLAGQQRVLGEEISRRQEQLGEFGSGSLVSGREAAAAALDQLHVAVVERQAHLMNCEDLAHLLDCKIQALAERLVHLDGEADTSTTPEAIGAPSPTPERTSGRQERRDRGQLEDELRARISQRRQPPRR